MNRDWAAGYSAALVDLEYLAWRQKPKTLADWEALIERLRHDATVIKRTPKARLREPPA